MLICSIASTETRLLLVLAEKLLFRKSATADRRSRMLSTCLGAMGRLQLKAQADYSRCYLW